MNRRRQAIVLAYLTMGAFLLAHLLNAFVSQALTRPILVEPTVAPQGAATNAQVPSARLAEEILNAGLFSSVRSGAAEGMRRPGGQAIEKPLDAAKKVKLAGTVVGEGLGAIAIVEDLRSKKQILYHLHEHIPDLGEIAEVRRDGIMLQEGDQSEFLELAVARPDRPGMSPPPTALGATPTARQAPSGGRMTLDRRAVSQSMADVPKLLSQAQAVPYYQDGKLMGWRIDAIKPDSFYEKIGLQAGDVLQRVNGVEIRDPGMVLTLFQQVKDERQVKLDLLRDSRRATLMYDIR
jgi:general secretion pathway protein C